MTDTAKLTEDQIKHMADRFLGWRLPENFNPDGGISFERFGNKGTPHQYEHRPIGTNLLDATQATAMVRYMAEGMPSSDSALAQRGNEGAIQGWRPIETAPKDGTRTLIAWVTAAQYWMFSFGQYDPSLRHWRTTVADDTHFQKMYLDIVERFVKDPIAIQFLREDGEGGFGSGIYRMAREIERLWKKCGEPETRDPRWQDEEDEQIDAERDAEIAKLAAQAQAGGGAGG